MDLLAQVSDGYVVDDRMYTDFLREPSLLTILYDCLTKYQMSARMLANMTYWFKEGQQDTVCREKFTLILITDC